MTKNYEIMSCDESPSYRYRLDVSTRLPNSRAVIVIQLNPSTADASHSDPTIGKVSYWAKEHGYGTVTFLNLFAFRTAYPTDLVDMPYEALVGSRNDEVTDSAFKTKATIICAWGRLGKPLVAHYNQRVEFLRSILSDTAVYAVGQPVAGLFPRHGRMWNGNNRTLRPTSVCAV